MDSILIRLFKKTCGLSFTRGWICGMFNSSNFSILSSSTSETYLALPSKANDADCSHVFCGVSNARSQKNNWQENIVNWLLTSDKVTQIQAAGSPFDDYILFSLGYLVSAALVLPLSMLTLVKNIKVQIASAATLFFIIGAWIVIFKRTGLGEPIPAGGRNYTNLIGFVLNNFAFITTVPSFINELNRKVSIHKVVCTLSSTLVKFQVLAIAFPTQMVQLGEYHCFTQGGTMRLGNLLTMIGWIFNHTMRMYVPRCWFNGRSKQVRIPTFSMASSDAVPSSKKLTSTVQGFRAVRHCGSSCGTPPG